MLTSSLCWCMDLASFLACCFNCLLSLKVLLEDREIENVGQGRGGMA